MPSSPFQLVSRSPRVVHPAHLANGNIGLQTSALGLGSSRSFMAGVLDLSPEDITRPARLPDWHGLEIHLEGRSIGDGIENITEYAQVLDLEKGWLETRYIVKANGATCRIVARHILARHDGELALIEWTITALTKSKMELIYPITAHEEPLRHPFRTLEKTPPGYEGGFDDQRMSFRWHPGHMVADSRFVHADSLILGAIATAKGNGPSVGICVALLCNRQALWRERTGSLRQEVAAEFTLNASETLALSAFAAFARDDEPEALLQRAKDKALMARQRGPEVLKESHVLAWKDLWRSDILIEGDDALQLQARTDLFYLLQATRSHSPWSMPVFGISSTGYNGAIFWDADLYMYPALLPLHPDFAQGYVDFRFRTLAPAIRHAEACGLRGAKYPWESDLIWGRENTAPNSSPLCNKEIHVNSAIALAQWWYYCSTGDLGWLRERGYPVISAVAEYWTSQVVYAEKLDQYVLPDVFCVDEASGIVDNCIYTNASAVRAIEIASTCAGLLGLPANPQWKSIAAKMRILKAGDLFPAHDKTQAGTLFSNTLLNHPLEWPMAEKERTKCLMEPYPWDMSLQACLAGMAGDSRKMREYFDFQASHFINPPFGLRAEFKGRDSVPMHTGCGAFLQGWLYGVTGMRWRKEGLVPVYAPCLPEGIRSVTITSAQWHGRRHALQVKEGKLTIEPI